MIIYWDRFGCMWEKERVLGEEKKIRNLKGRESVETDYKCEN